MQKKLAIPLFIALLLLAAPSSSAASSGLAPVDKHVSDRAGILRRSYAEDLNARLERYATKTGYGIYIVMLRDHDELRDFATQVFASEQLEKLSADGTVALLIAHRNKEARILTSENLRPKFAQPQTITDIEKALRRVGSPNRWDRDYKIEFAVEDSVVWLNDTIDPWFYVLEPTSIGVIWRQHSISAEMILFPLAPFAALMTAIILMALTAAGSLSCLRRLMISGVAACAVGIAAAFFFRQPGGIVPGAVIYSAVAGFVVGGIIGALKPFWFNDKFTGKTSDAWWSGPVHFHWG